MAALSRKLFWEGSFEKIRSADFSDQAGDLSEVIGRESISPPYLLG